MTQQNVVDAANQLKQASDAYASEGEGVLPSIETSKKAVAALVEQARVHMEAVKAAAAALGVSNGTTPVPANTDVDLFIANYAGKKVLFDLSNSGSRFQDPAGTSALSVAGQTLGRLNDLSGGGNHVHQPTAGKRPVFGQENGRSFISADGIDDCLFSINTLDLSAYNKLTMIFGVRKRVTGQPAIVLEFGGNAEGNGAFGLEGSAGGFNLIGTGSGAVAEAYLDAPSPDLSVVTAQIDLTNASGWAVKIQHNNDAATSTTTVGSQGFRNTNLNFFSRDTYALFGAIDLYGFMLLAGDFPSDANLLMLRRYVASRIGVTL